jgi:hypothetical protein
LDPLFDLVFDAFQVNVLKEGYLKGISIEHDDL